jgi:uncharacterized membrane-anchored protein
MRRSAGPVLPLCISIALAASLHGGSALADLPRPPPPAPQKAATPAAKPSKATAANAKGNPSAAPTAEPSVEGADGEGAIPAELQLSERDKAMLAIPWQPGPTTGALGAVAEIAVPEGFLFVDGDGTRKFLELNENLTNGKELGMVAAKDFSWFVAFEFSDIGYVKDDEKGDLDADAILTSLREGNEAGNAAKRTRGWRTLTLLGWASPPKYDQASQNLEWAPKFQDDIDKQIAVNHFIRVLGREGVMEVSLVTSPEDYAKTLPETKTLLGGFSFKTGHRYSEYKQGDRIAAIGLTGLITGGAIAAAAKTGILAKMGKGIVKIVAIVGAAAAAGLAKLLGRKKDQG